MDLYVDTKMGVGVTSGFPADIVEGSYSLLFREEPRVFSPKSIVPGIFFNSLVAAEISSEAVKLGLWHGSSCGVRM